MRTLPPEARARVLWIFLLCLTVGSVIPTVAWGRAGGGENFGGGGGGGGGHGGGFSGGGGGFGGGGYSGYRHTGSSGPGTPVSPIVLIFIAVIVLIIISNAMQAARQQHVTRTVQRGNQRQAEQLRQAALQAIQQRDPAFALEAFLARVETAFQKIQVAWSEQELGPVRAFLSDGVSERFSLQIKMLQAAGSRNVVRNVQVLSRQPAALYSTKQFDTIHVRIAARAEDFNVDLKTGKTLPGTENTGDFVEFWSFNRRPGAKSLQANGAIEGQCPRCGAALKIVDQAKCPACGAQVNSGEYDWVLSEITQESEFTVPGSEQDLPGIADLQSRDPGFNTLHIEDRVSVMFWRMRAAEFYGDVKYSAPIMTAEMTQDFRSALSSHSRYWKDAAVGQVEVMDAQSGEGGTDQLRVKVRWSGILLDRSTSRPQVLRDKSIYTHAFTLMRQHDTQTNPAGTFTSAGCSQCGAPLDVNENGACVYCGATLTNGQYDWVLSGIEKYTEDMARQHFATLQNARTQGRSKVAPATDTPLALAILAQAALVDGVLDERERSLLKQLGARRGMTSDQVEEVIHQTCAHDTQLPTPANPQQARDYLSQLVHVFLADGTISRSEEKLIAAYATSVGLTPADVRLAVNQERTRVYQGSKES